VKIDNRISYYAKIRRHLFVSREPMGNWYSQDICLGHFVLWCTCTVSSLLHVNSNETVRGQIYNGETSPSAMAQELRAKILAKFG